MVEGQTTAPPLLQEADLIALMEKHGIGIVCTYICMCSVCVCLCGVCSCVQHVVVIIKIAYVVLLLPYYINITYTGTDATHAEHIETIKQRQYVGVQPDGSFVPGELGMGLVEGRVTRML